MQDELERLVENWVRPEIRELSAYHVQPAQGLIKLDAMENPYTWPDELREAWTELLRSTDVNRYPDPSAAALTERLRHWLHAGVPQPPDVSRWQAPLLQAVWRRQLADGQEQQVE